MKVTYEILDTVENVPYGDRVESRKFWGQFLFTGLTVEHRELIGLPLTKPNPDYDPEDDESEEYIPVTDDDTIYNQRHTGNVATSFETHDEILDEITRKMEKIIAQYRQVVKINPPASDVTLTGTNIVSKLKEQVNEGKISTYRSWFNRTGCYRK